MMTAGEFCNRTVVVVGKDESVLEAARLMREHHVGDVVVVEERDRDRFPIGIVTDRDIVVAIVAKAAEFLDTLGVGEIMTDLLTTASEDDPLWSVLKLMRGAGVRRLPVIDKAGVLVGIITFDDLVGYVADELNDLVSLLSHEQTRELHRRP